MHSSLSTVKYFYIRVHWFYIKSNSGRILYWIILHSFTLLPNWEGVFRELKYSWKVILEFAFSRKKKSVSNHCKFRNKVNQPTKKRTLWFSSVEIFFKVSSNSCEDQPCNWSLSDQMNNLTYPEHQQHKKKRLKIKILLESFPF